MVWLEPSHPVALKRSTATWHRYRGVARQTTTKRTTETVKDETVKDEEGKRSEISQQQHEKKKKKKNIGRGCFRQDRTLPRPHKEAGHNSKKMIKANEFPRVSTSNATCSVPLSGKPTALSINRHPRAAYQGAGSLCINCGLSQLPLKKTGGCRSGFRLSNASFAANMLWEHFASPAATSETRYKARRTAGGQARGGARPHTASTPIGRRNLHPSYSRHFCTHR